MKIQEITAKSILSPSKIPSADYVINPYSGCAFGCIYCYAEFMRKFSGHMEDEWGSYVDIKVNAPQLLVKELTKLNTKLNKDNNFKRSDRQSIFIGSVTDPYQSIEAKYQITRKCLELIAESEVNDIVDVSLLTKSSLVTKDIDVFKRIKNMEVGITITSTDDGISRLFEVNAPISSVRLKALKELNKAGINTYVFVGPLLPHYVKEKKNLKKLFAEINYAGTKKIFVEHLNLSWNKWTRLKEKLGDELNEGDIELYEQSQKQEYKDELSEYVLALVKEYDFELVGGEVIDHQRIKE